IRGPHAGIAAARNLGLAAARAPFVAFHDSDDLALPGRLAVPLAYLRAHPDVDLVIQNGRMLPADRPWIAPRVAGQLAGRALGVLRAPPGASIRPAREHAARRGRPRRGAGRARARPCAPPARPALPPAGALAGPRPGGVMRVAFMHRRLAGGGTEADLRRLAA